MPAGRIAGILLLAGTAAACGDDTAARDCQQPGDPKRQAEACTRVIASDSKSAKAYNNRCLAYNQMDQHEKALADCNQAIRLDPNSASAYNNRGWAYEMTRQFDLALKDYGKAIQLDVPLSYSLANTSREPLGEWMYATTGPVLLNAKTTFSALTEEATAPPTLCHAVPLNLRT